MKNIKNSMEENIPGMRVGGSHKCIMTKASGVEKKITPDKWELFILSTKRGLGMPQKDQEFQSERSIIGIFLAHQNVQNMQTTIQLQ